MSNENMTLKEICELVGVDYEAALLLQQSHRMNFWQHLKLWWSTR